MLSARGIQTGSKRCVVFLCLRFEIVNIILVVVREKETYGMATSGMNNWDID